MAIATDPSLLLAQWLSPAFPVGGFAYSHGLETALADGLSRSETGFADWLAGVVHHGAGRNDLILLAASAATDDPTEADAMARAYAPSAERLRETVDQGAAFVTCYNAVWGPALPPLTLPVALGQAARAQDVPVALAAAHYLQGFVSNLTSAAVRLVPLGQTAGQRVIRDTMAGAQVVISDAVQSKLADLGGAAFAADIAAMRHETQDVRLFRS